MQVAGSIIILVSLIGVIAAGNGSWLGFLIPCFGAAAGMVVYSLGWVRAGD